MENVGEKILSLRKEKHVSQEQLAERLDVARQTVSKWETNAAQPSTENIKCLCAFFGVTSAYFFNDAEIAPMTSAPPLVAAQPQKKESRFGTLKIVSAAVGIVSLALIIIACGIAAYVIIEPGEGGAWSGADVKVIHRINYEGIIVLVIGILSFTVFTTLIAIYIVKLIKKRKNK